MADEKERKVSLTNEQGEPPLKFGEYKTSESGNDMFVGANGFPIPMMIPSSIGGTFSRVVKE